MTATRVLLVEDEEIIRMVTAEFLQDEGFEVIQAWDGDEAVKLLDGADGFDVLFTDVRMPGTCDGIDLAIHARCQCPSIPVLVVSGYASRPITRLGVLKPLPVFISKPYNLHEVVNVLKSLTTRP